jgi:phosphopantothenoylcysteine decarboxylase/phosphopantothenate--cysteine ligase
MKLLITSGGTREPIDAARFVTNLSTGRTGRVLAETLAGLGCRVRCLRASGSERPSGKNIRLGEFSSFKSLDEALKKALAAETFHAVIHLAAVSDYSPALIEAGGRTFVPGRGTKLDSSLPELRVTLKRNFKILDRIKSYAAAAGRPEPLLVAFKLTAGVSPAKAMAKVRALSAADLVVHNDLSEMKNRHPFHLYRSGKRIGDCEGQEELSKELYRHLKGPAGLAPGQDKQNPVGGRRLRSAEAETGKRAHGVRDAVFAFLPGRQPGPNKRKEKLCC